MAETNNELSKKIEKLTNIGISLSAEDNKDRLLEMILLGAKELTNSNAGTLYLLEAGDKLRMETLLNDDLHLAYGGTTGKPVPFEPISLYKDGQPNHKNVVTHAVLSDKTINIADAYHETGFDFSGMRTMDKKTGFHSQSFLTVPLKNHKHKIIGVLQLINCQDKNTNKVIPFDQANQELAESLASQAAITLTNKALLEEQKQLFEDFIKLIAKAIDSKSPYTGGHCSRVPVISLMLAEALNNTNEGNLKNFSLSEDEMYELKIASWLHDCGKVTTPEYVMDKATKLESIMDGVHLVNLRFEIILQQKLLEFKEGRCSQAEYSNFVANIAQDREFLQRVNFGGEFLSAEEAQRIQDIGEKYILQLHDGSQQSLLSTEEINNLQIARGTLNDEERQKINNHVSMTLEMLNSLHYPDNLVNVPEIAGSHHERVDGKGYPRHLTAKEMSVQARIVAISDVFEALTAADRPYKSAKSLSESLKILGFMCKEGHIDPDLFKIFVKNKIYLTYANQYLKPKQIDHIDESKIPGLD